MDSDEYEREEYFSSLYRPSLNINVIAGSSPETKGVGNESHTLNCKPRR